MTSAGKVIYGALNGNVAGLTRVSPKFDANVRPMLVYSAQSLPPTRTKTAIIARNYNVNLTIFADTYTACEDFTASVIALLEVLGGTTVNGNAVRYCTTAFTGDIFEEEIGFGTDITINLTLNEG